MRYLDYSYIASKKREVPRILLLRVLTLISSTESTETGQNKAVFKRSKTTTVNLKLTPHHSCLQPLAWVRFGTKMSSSSVGPAEQNAGGQLLQVLPRQTSGPLACVSGSGNIPFGEWAKNLESLIVSANTHCLFSHVFVDLMPRISSSCSQ